MYNLLIYVAFKSFYNSSKPNCFRFKVGVSCSNRLRYLNKIFYMHYYATPILTICYYTVFTVLSSVITSNHNYKMLTFFAAYHINSYKRQWEAFTFNTGTLLELTNAFQSVLSSKPNHYKNSKMY